MSLNTVGLFSIPPVLNHRKAVNRDRVTVLLIILLLLLHLFNGLFSRATWVRRYEKGKNETSVDLNESGNDGVWGCTGISWTMCSIQI